MRRTRRHSERRPLTFQLIPFCVLLLVIVGIWGICRHLLGWGNRSPIDKTQLTNNQDRPVLLHQDHYQHQDQFQNEQDGIHRIPKAFVRKNREHKIAVLIPYMGDSFPSYFPLFLRSAGGSAGFVDFLVFHTGVAGTQSGGEFSGDR